MSLHSRGEDGQFTLNDWKLSLIDESDPDAVMDLTVNAASAKEASKQALNLHPGWVIDATPTRPGEIVWLWEVRFGYLETSHFNLSNTEGDSGKTAVVNAEGMNQLKVIYFDPRLCPFTKTSRYMKERTEEAGGSLPLFKD